jgi:histone H3/H4
MPGSKTAMEINRLQKSGDMLLQHAPFNNLVRELIRSEKFRLTADFCKTLQAFAESQLIILMQRANKLASHSSRETVYSRDIELACSLFGEHLTEQDVKTNIPEASLRQLALRAGIQRYGDCSTNSYRNYLVYILKKYLQDIVLCAKHHKLQTLNTKLLLEGMSIHNIHPTIIHHKRKIAKTEQVNKEETTEVSEF